jgi:hypothetical protein
MKPTSPSTIEAGSPSLNDPSMLGCPKFRFFLSKLGPPRTSNIRSAWLVESRPGTKVRFKAWDTRLCIECGKAECMGRPPAEEACAGVAG